MKETEVLCYICNKPVDLSVARSGDDGKPCHGDCYVSKKSTLTEKLIKDYNDCNLPIEEMVKIYRNTNHVPNKLEPARPVRLPQSFIDYITSHTVASELDGDLRCIKCGGRVTVDWDELQLDCEGCDEL